MSQPTEHLEARIVQAVAGIDGIGTLALFGSRARNRARPDSDLDIAILPKRAGSTVRRRLIARASAALAALVPSGRVDVVLIDEAPELLRHRIFAHGQVVVQHSIEGWRAWRVRTMREHGDREPYRRMLREAAWPPARWTTSRTLPRSLLRAVPAGAPAVRLSPAADAGALHDGELLPPSAQRRRRVDGRGMACAPANGARLSARARLRRALPDHSEIIGMR